MNGLWRAIKLALVWIAVLAFTGCTLRPSLIDAYVKRVDETEIVEVTLRSADARTIKQREIYFSIVVLDCENNDKRFPIEPYVAGQIASRFDFPISSEFVTVHGSMPRRVLDDFPTPCVFLQGGSYIFGKLESATAPLVRRADAG